MVKTIFATIMYSVWMMILPAPEHAIVSDPLTACLLGGILTGIGVGIVLTTGAAGGGQDIVGMCITERNPKASVGIMYIIINLFVYGCCYFIYDMERVIYSLIYTTLMALVLDRYHKRNILVGVMVFTKKEMYLSVSWKMCTGELLVGMAWDAIQMRRQKCTIQSRISMNFLP